MSSEWRSLKYQWRAARGHVTVISELSLVFDVNPIRVNGREEWEINRLVDVVCSKVTFHGNGYEPHSVESDRHLLVFYATAFKSAYEINDDNTKAEVDEEVAVSSKPFHDDAYRAA